MRSIIFRIFFGADEISTRMFKLLNLRKAAVKLNTTNIELEQKLNTGKYDLLVIKEDYGVNQAALEKAYRLEF